MFALLMGLVATLLFACHLMCVNVATIGPLACLGFERRARRGDGSVADRLGHRLAHLGWQALLAGIVLGLLLASLRWWQGGSPFFASLARIPRGRITWGVAELAFYFLCIVPYAVYWDRLRHRKWLHRGLALLAASNLMYHFPPLFVAIGVLGESGGPAVAILDKSAFRHFLIDPAVLSRVTHHLVAAVATTNVVVMLLAERFLRQYEQQGAVAEQESAKRFVRAAAWWALGASLLQIPVGVWVLLSLSNPMRQAVLGNDMTTTLLFCTSIVAALGLLHHLASVAMGEVTRRTVRLSAGLLVLVIVLMTATLRG